jgi:hypothetical protein
MLDRDRLRSGGAVNCWHCDTELIWGGDHSFEDYGLDDEGIVSNLSCPNCPTTVLVEFNITEDNKNTKERD